MKEPYFIPKDLRMSYRKIEHLSSLDERIRERVKLDRIHRELQNQDKEQSQFPSEQWALSPYCLECGYMFYSYDLYKAEPAPAIFGIPNIDTLFI